MASTSRIPEAPGHGDSPSVQDELTALQNELQRMRSDCAQHIEREGVRAGEKERSRAEKEAIWEQLRMEVAQIVDGDAEERGRAARRAEGKTTRQVQGIIIPNAIFFPSHMGLHYQQIMVRLRRYWRC